MEELPALKSSAVKSVSGFLQIVGAIILIGAIIGFIYGLSVGYDEEGLVWVVGSLALGLLGPIWFFAGSQALKLLFHIEQNTRQPEADPEDSQDGRI